jgi:hypothetical protein
MDLEDTDLNRQFRQYHQDHEIDDPVALWGQSCMEFKILRVGHNPNRGFVRRTHGGLRRIVGPKVV